MHIYYLFAHLLILSQTHLSLTHPHYVLIALQSLYVLGFDSLQVLYPLVKLTCYSSLILISTGHSLLLSTLCQILVYFLHWYISLSSAPQRRAISLRLVFFPSWPEMNLDRNQTLKICSRPSSSSLVPVP